MVDVRKVTGAAQALLVLAALLPAGACCDPATWDRCKKEYDSREVLLPNQTQPSNASVLELNNCHLTEIHASDFNITMPNLMYIYFYYNNLRKVDPVVFANFPRVTSVFLDHNNLTEVPVFGQASVLPNLERLAIRHNQITALENPKTFSSTKLKLLNLENNLIEHINPVVFQGLILVQIFLSGNKLTYIPDKMFAIPSLDYVGLSSNQIEYVAPGAFSGTRLRFLYLHDNRLTHLPEYFVTDLTRTGILMSFHFENNPFQCACLSELLAEVKQIDKCDYGSEFYTSKSPMCEQTNDSQLCRRLTESEYISQRSTKRNLLIPQEQPAINFLSER